MQGIVLAATFAVSHNIEEAKPIAAGSATTSSLQTAYQDRDWGVQQVCLQCDNMTLLKQTLYIFDGASCYLVAQQSVTNHMQFTMQHVLLMHVISCVIQPCHVFAWLMRLCVCHLRGLAYQACP